MIILPDHPDFYSILHGSIPPEPDRSKAFIARSGSWVLEPASDRELTEYLEGGEYEQVLKEQGHDFLWLPDDVCL